MTMSTRISKDAAWLVPWSEIDEGDFYYLPQEDILWRKCVRHGSGEALARALVKLYRDNAAALAQARGECSPPSPTSRRRRLSRPPVEIT